MKVTKKQKGFTLIEILVTIVIISGLAAIALPTYNRAIRRAEAVEGTSGLETLSKAQNLYFIDHSGYTDDLSKLLIDLGNEDPLSSSKFTYSVGDVSEGQYCIYSESNKHDYVLAKNFKDNSEIICSGKDCSKIKDFVKEDSISEMCNGSFNGQCDLTSCGEGSTLNEEECKCEKLCKIEYCDNPNHVILNEGSANCYCGCGNSQKCLKGSNWNDYTCACETTSSCSITSCDNPNHIILNAGSADCHCGCLIPGTCEGKGLIWNEETCSCVSQFQ